MINKILAIITIILFVALGVIWANHYYQENLNPIKSPYFDFEFNTENANHSFLHQILKGIVVETKDISGKKSVVILSIGSDPYEIFLRDNVGYTKAVCDDPNQNITECLSEEKYQLQSLSFDEIKPGDSIRAMNVAKWNANEKRFDEEIYQILVMPSQIPQQ